MIALSADAEAAVRAARGAPDELRVVATSTPGRVRAPLARGAFADRSGRRTETSSGVAAGHETRALVENRPADVALGPYPGADHGGALVSAPLFRTRLVVVIGAGSPRPPGPPPQWSWLVDSSGTDPDADARRLLRRLEVAEGHVWVFPRPGRDLGGCRQERRAARAAVRERGAAPAVDGPGPLRARGPVLVRGTVPAGSPPPSGTTAGGARGPDSRRPGRRSGSPSRAWRGRTPGGAQEDPGRAGPARPPHRHPHGLGNPPLSGRRPGPAPFNRHEILPPTCARACSHCASCRATAMTSYGEASDMVFTTEGMEILKSPPRAPRTNARCEKTIGSIRREALDHVLIASWARPTPDRSWPPARSTTTRIGPIGPAVSCHPTRSNGPPP